MKACTPCGAVAPLEAATCSACGEASFAPVEFPQSGSVQIGGVPIQYDAAPSATETAVPSGAWAALVNREPDLSDEPADDAPENSPEPAAPAAPAPSTSTPPRRGADRRPQRR